MTDLKKNLIAGAWQPGESTIENHNPSDLSDLVGVFAQASAAWKIAPALAFGIAVVWKPANLTPASAVALTKVLARQDIPKGLVSLLTGAGDTIGQQLVESPLIAAGAS